ncbi:unnamed protein product [Peniophora sp. CBMAI 1063]|nr:unnamed protein product [Peniophora sp. CBMAI 1063]
MAAADPTYPLYPVVCFISTTMLCLVLLTSFARRNMNLGVCFLCFWLLIENLFLGSKAIIWADNADIKLYVFCDIGTRIQVLTSVVKPMATLILTRRLYLITSLRSVDALSSSKAKRKDRLIEWTLGLVIPIIVAGPFYYIVQGARFEVNEGFGCLNAQDNSGLEMLLVQSWNVVPPLLSITMYYPRVAWIFYRQNRDINQFLRSNESVSRNHYVRILILASIDILFTLPIGIVDIVLTLKALLEVSPVFYPGWSADHNNWDPISISYADFKTFGTASIAQFFVSQWSSPLLGLIVFGLFGATREARASYWSVVCTVGGWFGWRPTSSNKCSKRSTLGDIEFGEGPQQVSLDLEIGSQHSHIGTSTQLQEKKD